MTVDETIQVLRDWDGYFIGHSSDDVNEALDMAIEVLKQTHWIPVSEKLPNPKKDVLAYDGTDMFVAWYSDNEMWQGWSSYNSQFARDTPIIAWMPLPEPYKTDREE